MVVGQLLERMAGHAIDAGIADMKDVRSLCFDDQGAERADIAPVLVVGVAASPCLRMQPGVRRRDHALRRGFDRPGLRRTVIVGEKSLDRRLARDLADLAGADPVREHDRDALEAQERLFRDQDSVKILVDLLAAFVRVLPDRNFQFAWHRSCQESPNSTISQERASGQSSRVWHRASGR